MNSTASINELQNLWLRSLDVSVSTKQAYEAGLRTYRIWHVAFKNYSEMKFTSERILEFKQEKIDKVSPNSIRIYLASLKSFFSWAEKERHIMPNPMAGIRSPRPPKEYTKIPLTKDEAEKLLSSIDRNSISGKRNFAIVNLMLYLGLRRIEIIRLDVCDIVSGINGNEIRIFGKGCTSKDKTLPLPGFIFDIIEDYLLKRERYCPTDPLFPSTAYRNNNGRLSDRFVSGKVKELMRHAGVNDPRISCHSLRHTAAVLLIKSGCPHIQVQTLLRHTSAEVTRIYTRYIERQQLMEETGKYIEKLHNSMIS